MGLLGGPMGSPLGGPMGAPVGGAPKDETRAQVLQRKLAVAYMRAANLWEDYGKTLLHYGWVPGVIVMGESYSY